MESITGYHCDPTWLIFLIVQTKVSMGNIHYIVLIIFLCKNVKIFETGRSNFGMVKRDITLTNKFPTYLPIETIAINIKLKCIVKCIIQESCRIVFFNHIDRMCSLYSISRMAARTSNINKIGWEGYHKKLRKY